MRLPRLVQLVKLKLLIITSTNRGFLWLSVFTFTVTFILLLPLFYIDNPYSAYFVFSASTNDKLSRKVMEQNRKRLEEAKTYLANINKEESLKNYKKLLDQRDIDIIVAVITVKRLYGPEEGGYLTQTLSKLDALFEENKSHFPKKALFLCNAHAGPGEHSEARWLSEYFPTVVRFEVPDTKSVIMHLFEKEKQDYVFCLEKAYAYKAKYVMLVEDDAVPYPELFCVLESVLETRINKRWLNGELTERPKKSWAYLKLFYPEKWQGFGSELLHFIEVASIGAIGGGLSVVLLNMLFYRNYYVNLKMYYMTFLMGLVYSILFALLVGRQSLLELRRVSVGLWNIVPAPDCCSPGILYPNETIGNLIKYLKSVQSQSNFGVDLALEQFVSQHGYEKFLTEPNLFKHIGYISTLKGPSSNPAMFLD